MKTIKILIPIYNEEESLLFLRNRLTSIIDKLTNYRIEVLFINDGSKDNSLKIIEGIRKKDNRFEYISFSRNFGKEIAIIAGLDYSRKSDAVIIMDADLQDPPELIPEMIQEWEKGYDDVYATRKTRDGETWLKKFTSTMYYKTLQKFTKIPISHDKKGFGFVFEKDGKSLAYMTDTGMIHSRYHEKMKNKTVYLLESNHDVEMEMNGNKFEYIKYRNIGDEGHLSNEDCAKYLNHFIGPNTKYIMLVHISENDNTYEKAYEANRKAIDSNIPIYVAYKDKLSETIEV